MAENEHMHADGQTHSGDHSQQPTAPVSGGNKDVEENKMIAALGYVWVLALVPFLAKKDSPFAQFHAKQGMVLFIGEVASAILYIVPVVNIFWFFIGWIVSLLFLVLSIIGIINAYNGQMKELPVIGGIAKQLFK